MCVLKWTVALHLILRTERSACSSPMQVFLVWGISELIRAHMLFFKNAVPKIQIHKKLHGYNINQYAKQSENRNCRITYQNQKKGNKYCTLCGPLAVS